MLRSLLVSRQTKKRLVQVLEALEGRTLFSTFTVLTLADGGEGSLRQAILDANASPGADTIDFTTGLTGTIALTTGELSIASELTIDGPGADLMTVSGNQQSRVFNISGGATVAIEGLMIADGHVTGSPAQGGGILNTGSVLAVAGVVFTNNEAVGAPGGIARGGAIANMSGATLTVTESLFTENRSVGGSGGALGAGGAVANQTSGLTVSRSAFMMNRAIGGNNGGQAVAGGIVNGMVSIATVADSNFVGNEAIAGDGSGGNGFATGGGLYNNRSTLTVDNCTILENLARGGSGNIRNDRVVGAASGGGLANADVALLSLNASLVSGNRAVGGSNNTCTGGNADVGTAFGGGMTNVGTATVSDTIFEDNEAFGGNGNRGNGVGFQFVGTGTGGGIATSARSATLEHNVLTLDNVTIRQNRAVGGDGNTTGTIMNAGIGGGLGNNGSNPFAPVVSAGSELTIWNSTIDHNQARGGTGGAALGGGIANLLGGVATISGGTITHNHAHGGAGGTTGAGGDGLGGGVFNDAASTHSSNFDAPTIFRVSEAALTHNMALGGDGEANGGDGFGGGVYTAGNTSVIASIICGNHANGGDGGAGGSDGEGIGGGVYVLGAFEYDSFTVIQKNHASTSDDDIFGLI